MFRVDCRQLLLNLRVAGNSLGTAGHFTGLGARTSDFANHSPQALACRYRFISVSASAFF